jgi:MinD superfamily P-loop ATPase
MNNPDKTKQIVIISGKGGTGKTTLAAALTDLAENQTIADCDVDAADLHILLKPEITDTQPYSGGKKAFIVRERCTECGICEDYCRFDAIHDLWIDPIACEGCGFCVKICPERAINFNQAITGSYRQGIFDHSDFFGARLQPGEGSSGKLVSQVKQQAQKQAETVQRKWFFIDGPPGIGCPVNASVTGADLILAVTEPAVSGLHDLQRVIHLALSFNISVAVVINKHDLNFEITRKIEHHAAQNRFPVIGYIPFDEQVVTALMQEQTITKYPDCPAAREIEKIWANIQELLID